MTVFLVVIIRRTILYHISPIKARKFLLWLNGTCVNQCYSVSDRPQNRNFFQIQFLKSAKSVKSASKKFVFICVYSWLIPSVFLCGYFLLLDGINKIILLSCPNIRVNSWLFLPKSRSAKKVFKTGVFLSIFDNFLKFLQKNAKKCKFLLIFTPIFTPKTYKSYKTTLFTTTNHPIFQNFPQKPLFSWFFIFFYPHFGFILFGGLGFPRRRRK